MSSISDPDETGKDASGARQSAEQEAVHFLPYGSYVASCGRIEDQRHPHRWSDLRREATCADCQAQMIDLGDLPPSTPPGQREAAERPTGGDA